METRAFLTHTKVLDASISTYESPQISFAFSGDRLANGTFKVFLSSFRNLKDAVIITMRNFPIRLWRDPKKTTKNFPLSFSTIREKFA